MTSRGNTVIDPRGRRTDFPNTTAQTGVASLDGRMSKTLGDEFADCWAELQECIADAHIAYKRNLSSPLITRPSLAYLPNEQRLTQFEDPSKRFPVPSKR